MVETMEAVADSDSDVEFVGSCVKPTSGATTKSGLVVIEKVNSKNLSEKDKLGLSEDYYKGLNSYVCEGCDRRFFQMSLFVQHICRITSYTAFNCLDCGTKLTFSNMCRLKRHINEHKRYNNKVNKANMEDMVVELPDLDDFQKVFSYNFKENNDLLGKLDKRRGGQCWECSCKTMSLKDHYSVVRKYQMCEVCSLELPNRCSLEAHLRVHRHERPHTCPDCGKSFITFAGLHQHLLTVCLHQFKAGRYKCPLCMEFKPSDKVKLHHHLRTHCRTVFNCSVCDRSFDELTSLKEHLTTHEGHIPPMRLVHHCPLCSEVLPSKDMDLHLEGHIGDELLVCCLICVHCGTQSTDLEDFRRHVTEKRHYQLPSWDGPRSVLAPYPPAQGTKRPLSHRVKDRPGPSKGVCRLCKETLNEPGQVCRSCRVRDVYCRCALCGITLRRVNSIIEYHLRSVHNVTAKKDFSGYLVGPRRRAPEAAPVAPVASPPPQPADPLACRYCATVASSTAELRAHYPSHRGDSQYQCLECGECFVSASSLSIHLVSFHSLSRAQAYISNNDVRSAPRPPPPPPLRENQCSECLSDFPDAKALQMHFRSHGLAFLRQKMSKKPVTPQKQSEEPEKDNN